MNSLQQVRTLFLEGKRREAVASARELSVADPSLLSFLALGTVELSIEQLNRATQAFQSATEADPSCASAWNDHGSCLAKGGQFRGAAASFSRAAELSDDPSAPLANWGSCLLQQGEPEEAEARFKQSLRARSNPNAALGLCRTWAGLKKTGEALQLCKAILHSGEAPFAALDAMLEQELGSPAERLAWAKKLKEQNPGHAGVRALFRRALSEVSPDEHLRELRNYQQYTQIHNAHLDQTSLKSVAARVNEHPSFHQAPSSHATRGGWHSGDLFQEPEVSLQDLQALLTTFANQYREVLNGRQPDTDFALTTPKNIQVHAWAVRLSGSHFQERHFHPEAWASGCLYLRVPKAVDESTSDGHLYFSTGRESSPRTVCPQEGRIVMFPSCLDHGTLPFSSNEERLSVAFDVIAQ